MIGKQKSLVLVDLEGTGTCAAPLIQMQEHFCLDLKGFESGFCHLQQKYICIKYVII